MALELTYAQLCEVLASLPSPALVFRREQDDFVLVFHNEAMRSVAPQVSTLLGRRFLDVQPERTDIADACRRALAERSTVALETKYRLTTTGSERDFRLSCVGISPDLVAIHVDDRTPMRAAIAALLASEERLRIALSAGRMAAWRWDCVRQVVTGEEGLAQVFGFPAGAPAVGIPVTAWTGLIHADDRERVAGEALEHLSDPTCEQYALTYRIRKVDDGDTRWVRSDARVFRDGAGVPTHIIGISADVTEHKGLEHELLQAQKLEALGRLAGGVAHDFNNLLTAILGAAEVARRSAPGSPEIETIQSAAQRASELTRQLLAFARRQVVQLRTVDVAATVRTVERLIERAVGESVSTSIEIDSDTWTTRADPGQLAYVLLNLAVNAREAMPSGGKLTIAAGNVTIDATSDGRRLPPGQYVRLRIVDTGTGIPSDVIEHVFEPFFTTKEHGTGLGLASCQGVVAQLGGHIEIDSPTGAGTTVSVYLRRSHGAVAQAQERALNDGSCSELLVVVEDEPLVRGAVVRGLRAQGYEVVAAANGREALPVLAQLGPRVKALVTDVVMPQMGGIELARKARDARPDLAVLFVSGYADTNLDAELLSSPRTGFLQKPFTASDLSAKLRELLD